MTVFDVKTLDTLCPTAIQSHHTDRQRLRAHEARIAESTRDYGDLPPRWRLVTLVVSPLGSLSRSFLSFLSELSRRSGGDVPPSLFDEASWATPRAAPARPLL